jgi:hypothetical protein
MIELKFEEFDEETPKMHEYSNTSGRHYPRTLAYKAHLPHRKELPSGFEVPKSLGPVFRRMSATMKALAERVMAGDLDAQGFADAAYDVLADEHSRAWYLGRVRAGSKIPMSDADLQAGRIAADIDSEYLARWRDDILNGRYFDGEEWNQGAMLTRANAYALKLRGTANESFVTDPESAPFSFNWKLGNSEHCQDCIDFASLSPWQADELPSFPGDCSTVCKMGCNCTLIRSDGRQGFEPFT